MTRATWLIGGAVVAVIIIAVGVFLWRRPPAPSIPIAASNPFPIERTNSESGPTTGGTSSAPGYTASTDTYDVNASAPLTVSLSETAGAAADSAAVATIQSYEREAIQQFESDADTLSTQDKQDMGIGAGRKESLSIAYEPHASAHTVSVVLTVTSDTLGAHPNQYFKTYTFDRATGASLALSDLFTPNAAYLSALTAIARADLPSVIPSSLADMTNIDSGTASDAANFSNFVLDGGNLVILFPPYQVAPYAAGMITLPIPLTQLQNILKPQYLP